MVSIMAQRDELFRKFGPILLEAIVWLMAEECNRLRTKLGMQTITKEMFFDEINNHLSEIELYDWMNEGT